MLKKWLPLIAGAALCLGTVAGCDKDEDKGKKDDTSKKPATDVPTTTDTKVKKPVATPKPKPKRKDTWKEYVDKEGGFAVTGPSAPRKSTTKTPTPLGILELHASQYAAPGARGAMTTGWSDLPVPKGIPFDTKVALDSSRDGIVKQFGGKLSLDKKVMINGHPGIEFKFEANHPKMGPMRAHYRVAIKGHRTYQAGVVHAKGATKMATAGARFVASFRILEEKK